jgi:hypothetical protein
MTEQINSIRPDFFGKDSFVPFLGQVEDVNDPKMSGRVKVRCVGWHPKNKTGEDGLATDDLPWARVGMPTTHAQQSRIGGKHGLLAGSWVFGFFLDGDEANDPFVLSTFNFTAKANDKDTRQKDASGEGKINDEVEGFTKTEAGQENQPNTSTRTSKENGGTRDYGDDNDKSGDAVLSDADSDCGGLKALQSAASKAREEPMRTEQNPEGQKWGTTGGDGLCGSIPHARNDVQKKIAEQMPSALSRFNYGDVVWDNFSGNYMDLNGIMAKLSLDICSILKMVINSSKAATNEENRERHSTALKGTRDRVGNRKEQVDEQQQTQDDFFNGIFQTSLIDILCSLLMNMLQAMNNGGEGNEGDNNTGDIGANPNTPIMNPDAICIADTILDNIATITDDITEFAKEGARQRAESGDDENDIMSFVSQILGGLSSVMQFPLTQKYATQQGVHNKAGDMSQSQKTKEEGCRMERVFDTENGWLGSMMGFAGTGGLGGGGGGGDAGGGAGGVNEGSTGAGSSNSSGRERLTEVDFGGLPVGSLTGGQNNLLCEEATTIPVPDGTDVGSIYNPDDYPNLDLDNIPVIPRPSGERGDAVSISLPSSEPRCAKNYINGTPNQVVILNGGARYYFNNKKNTDLAFPSVYIRGYQGNPVPVVDKESGELVAILTNCGSWSPNFPGAPINVIPDNSEIGIATDNPDYDIVLGGFLISNTGRGYCNPRVSIYDRDKLTFDNGAARPVVVNGRIVDVELINNGTGFKRLPEIKIIDDSRQCGTSGGYGARVYPIMSVVAKPNAKPVPVPVQMIYCPGKNQRNLY